MTTEFHIYSGGEIVETFTAPMAPRCGEVLVTESGKRFRVDAVEWIVGAVDGSISVTLWCRELEL